MDQSTDLVRSFDYDVITELFRDRRNNGHKAAGDRCTYSLTSVAAPSAGAGAAGLVNSAGGVIVPEIADPADVRFQVVRERVW